MFFSVNNTFLYFLKRVLPLLVVILLFSVSCDHTSLTGEIIVDSSEFKIGNDYHLYLEVPPELDGIYWVTWEVEPAELVSINFELCSGPDCGKNSNYKGDRTAVITPLKSGEIEIKVSGFYKQTNPQPIARKKILLVGDK
ncbi:MAG: hypothetical protein PF693_03855 [Spirochaetia bacterium]|jgi:hypothetical protein|nr:hypothetical protein [Spirochaetia bacterium]